MKKNILALGLAVVLSASLTATAFATTKVVSTPTTKAVVTKAVTKTITFNPYNSDYPEYKRFLSTLAFTNVIAQETKDFSFYTSDDKKTYIGKKSNVITCKAPTTITLQPNKGEKYAGVYDVIIYSDSNKINPSTIKKNFKYYIFNKAKLECDFSKKLSVKPAGAYGLADGSTYTLTKAGTYMIYVHPYCGGVDDTETPLTPVFIIVK